MCKLLLEKHVGAKAVARVDLSAAAEAELTYKVGGRGGR